MSVHQPLRGSNVQQRPLGHLSREEEPNRVCLVKIGSVTRSSRARELLSNAGISAGVQKVPESPEGCAHGVTVSRADLEAALGLLRSAGIRPGSIQEMDENQQGISL